MKRIFFISIALLLCGSLFGQKHFEPSFREAKSLYKIAKDQAYTFGYLKVLENRSDPQSGTIEFPVYIFKSRSKNPKPDPIIYTVGGPGSSTMPSAQYMKYYQYLDDRDFILVEQRGNYYAKPHLDCPEWSAAITQINVSQLKEPQSSELLQNAAKACKERLLKKGIDLNGYNTNEIAADISDLTKTLGIESYNLLTISYSTKIAQVLLRDYPKGIRSVVMDSALPLEVSFDEESVANTLEKLEMLLKFCENDSICGGAYPNIQDRFFSFLREKTIKPLEVSVTNPNTGVNEKFLLKGEDLISVFTNSTSGNIQNVPFEINKLLENDLSTVKETLAGLFTDPYGGKGIGMRLSVWCAEEYPFNDQDLIQSETNRYPETVGLSPATYDATICDIWGVKKADPIENLPIKSKVPVLFINGEFDELTPPKWAAAMKPNFYNSYHLIFKGWKHTNTTNWENQCAMTAANEFFNNPYQAPIAECMKTLKTTFKVE